MMECPWCGTSIEIEQINCGIFRCGILKSNNEQIPPHLSKEECEKFVEEDLIYGCGKPFRYIEGNLEKCDYL